MDDLRGAKLIASAILIGAGGICLALGEAHHGLSLSGLALVAVGLPMLIIQWRRPAERPQRTYDAPPDDIETGFKETKGF